MSAKVMRLQVAIYPSVYTSICFEWYIHLYVLNFAGVNAHPHMILERPRIVTSRPERLPNHMCVLWGCRRKGLRVLAACVHESHGKLKLSYVESLGG